MIRVPTCLCIVAPITLSDSICFTPRLAQLSWLPLYVCVRAEHFAERSGFFKNSRPITAERVVASEMRENCNWIMTPESGSLSLDALGGRDAT